MQKLLLAVDKLSTVVGKAFSWLILVLTLMITWEVFSRYALDNPHPNSHDYEQLELIYAHLDSTTTIGSMPAGFDRADVSAQENWGALVSQDTGGRSALYMRDFGNGYKIFTFVIWAVE